MSIFEELDAEAQPRPTQCRLCRWLETQPEDEQEQWREALADKKRYQTAQIVRLLEKKEAEVPRNSVERHRARGHA